MKIIQNCFIFKLYPILLTMMFVSSNCLFSILRVFPLFYPFHRVIIYSKYFLSCSQCHFKMLCDEFAKLQAPEGLEETTTCQDFEYKAPSSPGSLTPTVVLEPVASTSASAASSSSSSQQASFGEIEKLMAELD